MDVTLTRRNDRVHFVATNPAGVEIHIDGAESVGGENAGFRPMEVALAALAGCASVDVVDILRKQRVGLTDIEIQAHGDRKPDSVPSPFTRIHLHFVLYGDIDRAKAERAVDLAVNKYCSVGEMLRHTVDIESSVEIRPAGREGR